MPYAFMSAEDIDNLHSMFENRFKAGFYGEKPEFLALYEYYEEVSENLLLNNPDIPKHCFIQ